MFGRRNERRKSIWNLNWEPNFELTDGTKVSRVYVFNKASVLTESSKVILNIINAVLTIPVAFKKRYYKNPLSFHISQDYTMPAKISLTKTSTCVSGAEVMDSCVCLMHSPP